jgi:nonribosomal peptide synthetase DhbF
MVADYIREIRQIQPSGPYHLLGWSFGAVAAHAIATTLQAMGEEVAFLCLLDAYPLSDVLVESTSDHGNEKIADQQLKDRLREKVKSHDFIQFQKAMVNEAIERIVNIVINNYRLIKNYRPALFKGDMLFGRCLRTDGVGPVYPAESWSKYVDGAIQIFDVDSIHEEMFASPGDELIGKTVNTVLSEMDNRATMLSSAENCG